MERDFNIQFNSNTSAHKNLSKKIKSILKNSLSPKLTNTLKFFPDKNAPTYEITKKFTNPDTNHKIKTKKTATLDYFFINKEEIDRIALGKVCNKYELDSDHKKVTIEIKINETFLDTPSQIIHYTPKIKTKQISLKKLTNTIEQLTQENHDN